MFSLFSLPCPAGLPATQQQAWDQRHHTAARILAQQAIPALATDPEMLAYLQQYVREEITLGQAIGRVLDRQARASH